MSALLKVLLSVLLLDLQSQARAQDPLRTPADVHVSGGAEPADVHVCGSTHRWQGEEGHADEGEGGGQQASGPGFGGFVSVADGGQRDLQRSEVRGHGGLSPAST